MVLECSVGDLSRSKVPARGLRLRNQKATKLRWHYHSRIIYQEPTCLSGKDETQYERTACLRGYGSVPAKHAV
jgi:hypothetical protein